MRARILLLLAVLPLACGRAAALRWPDAPVVIVSIDTLRADHLPVYGYAAGATPRLDALAREAVVFEDAYSHSPLTLPSHASLFTGLLPPHHGVRDNIGFRLKPEAATLASRLKAAGWRTGGAVSAFVLRGETGIGRDFEFYEDALTMLGGEESLGAMQRDGAVALEALSAWLARQGGARALAFLHLYEPHSPYAPPERHRRHALAYDGEIAYADELLGRFLDALKAGGVYERALIAVTSDHGEGLGDHGEQEHGIFLYREALRVPLLLRLPGGARGGSRVAGTVGLADLAPTLLDLLGQPRADMDGVSLRPSLRSGRAEARPGLRGDDVSPIPLRPWATPPRPGSGRRRRGSASRPIPVSAAAARGAEPAQRARAVIRPGERRAAPAGPRLGSRWPSSSPNRRAARLVVIRSTIFGLTVMPGQR